MAEMDNLLRDFLVESCENLEQVDRDLVALEKNPGDSRPLASIFRTIHTIKGTCGFFGFTRLEAVTHVGENLLCRLRDGELAPTEEIVSALLALVDAVRAMLGRIEAAQDEGTEEYAPLVALLTRLNDGGAAPRAVEPVRPTRPTVIDAFAELPHEIPAGEAPPAAAPPPAPPVSLPLEAPHAGGDGVAEPAHASSIGECNIRVDVSLLDKLMNLVGELVLARNQILQFTGTQKDTAFLSTSQRLNLITTELQEGVMKTRMQPIGNVWNRFPRVVRDLAVHCGKQVRVEMEGKETELDRTIIEAIKDPLTHVVRNSVDHGIEPPGVRVAAGKPAEGCLSLRAFHEGGQVNIEISDDGGGINAERVKNKALERGLISRDQAARMSERELTQLIFLPGFSTAEKITNVSGRGVGMDVVKTNIEKIGGAIDVQSQLGRGTTLKIKIPLTLAIIPALIVTSGGDRYAIPQVSLLELVRLDGAQAEAGIERIHGAPVYRLRGRLLPLVYLHQELGVEEARGEDGVVNIVVLQADDRQFGMVVEGINDTEEIVVKPMGQQLKGIPLFAGATIMGDGRVALILDVMGVAQRGKVISEVRDRQLAEQQAAPPLDRREERQTLLLFGLGKERRLAIPLSMVARLEELPASSIEHADGQEVVQYRDQLLPLLRLSDLLGVEPGGAAASPNIQVVVYSQQGQSVGLLVDQIIDIVETKVEIRRAGRRTGILGSAVVQQRVTDLLDLQAVIRAADPLLIQTETAGV
jgi:two-component system chemotaxis sensor kinase CheA